MRTICRILILTPVLLIACSAKNSSQIRFHFTRGENLASTSAERSSAMKDSAGTDQTLLTGYCYAAMVSAPADAAGTALNRYGDVGHNDGNYSSASCQLMPHYIGILSSPTEAGGTVSLRVPVGSARLFHVLMLTKDANGVRGPSSCDGLVDVTNDGTNTDLTWNGEKKQNWQPKLLAYGKSDVSAGTTDVNLALVSDSSGLTMNCGEKSYETVPYIDETSGVVRLSKSILKPFINVRCRGDIDQIQLEGFSTSPQTCTDVSQTFYPLVRGTSYTLVGYRNGQRISSSAKTFKISDANDYPDSYYHYMSDDTGAEVALAVNGSGADLLYADGSNLVLKQNNGVTQVRNFQIDIPSKTSPPRLKSASFDMNYSGPAPKLFAENDTLYFPMMSSPITYYTASRTSSFAANASQVNNAIGGSPSDSLVSSGLHYAINSLSQNKIYISSNKLFPAYDEIPLATAFGGSASNLAGWNASSSFFSFNVTGGGKKVGILRCDPGATCANGPSPKNFLLLNYLDSQIYALQTAPFTTTQGTQGFATVASIGSTDYTLRSYVANLDGVTFDTAVGSSHDIQSTSLPSWVGSSDALVSNGVSFTVNFVTSLNQNFPDAKFLNGQLLAGGSIKDANGLYHAGLLRSPDDGVTWFEVYRGPANSSMLSAAPIVLPYKLAGASYDNYSIVAVENDPGSVAKIIYLDGGDGY